MEFSEPIADIFALLYELSKPVLVVLVLAFLFLPKIATDSDNPRKVAQAFFGYLMQAVAVVLMSVSAIHTLIAVFDQTSYNPEGYLSLVLVFATGGILFLWSDQQIREIEEKYRLVPHILFIFSLKTVGHLAIVFSSLAIAWAIALGITTTAGWWVLPVVVLLYGLLLAWLTSGEPFRSPWSSQTRQVTNHPAKASRPISKKTSARKTAANSRKKK